MKAVVITKYGGPEVLQLEEVEEPALGTDEVLVQVAATALNRADTVQRKGAYPPPKGSSPYPGLEVSGTIIALGSSLSPGSPWNIGDQVMRMIN
jgi:NADPH:quinone reductase-like Zn-dependent oxidoreductase